MTWARRALLPSHEILSWGPTVGREAQTERELIALAKDFGFEKRFLDRPYHHTSGADLRLKAELAEIHVELKTDVGFIIHNQRFLPTAV